MDPRYETDPIQFPTAGDNQVPKPTVRRSNAIGICERSKQTSLKAIIQSRAAFPMRQYARSFPLGSLGAGSAWKFWTSVNNLEGWPSGLRHRPLNSGLTG